MEEFLYKKINYYFWLFCCLHLIVWTLAPTLIYANPPTDSLEGITWGNLWLWGYSKHPPLAPWLSAGITNLFGVVGWPLYLLSQISIISCFIALYQLGKKILPIGYVFLGILLLEGINFYNIESAIFNPNVLMLPLWAFMMLFFYNAITSDRLRDWLLLGICAGFALLTKYESALLMLVMGVFMLSQAKTRRYFYSSHLYFSAICAVIIFLPNLIWLYQHQFVAVTYALTEMQSVSPTIWQKIYNWFARPLHFLIEQIGAVAGLLLLYIPFYRGKKADLNIDDFNFRFIAFMALGPLIGTLLMSLLFQAELVSRWAFPFFSMLGMFLFMMFKPELTWNRLKACMKMTATFSVILLGAMVFYFQYLPNFQQRHLHSNSFPGKNIALTITQQWHDRFHEKLAYIGGDHPVSVNIGAFSPDKPQAFFYLSKRESPWINEENLRLKGAVFIVWMHDNTANRQIADIKKQYPDVIEESIQEFSRLLHAKAEPVKLWVAYLPPKKMSTYK